MIQADQLFYLVSFNNVTIVNPRWPNTNAVYQQLHFPDFVMSIDAVNILGR